jgi:putative flavoprotein involved in K+ transport
MRTRLQGRAAVDWVPVVVVGAGPAGLGVSSQLARTGCDHVVLERGRVGWSWRTQRWDSFRLNTPGWANRVPGELLAGSPASFASARSLIAGLDRLAEGLPVVEQVEVRRAERIGQAWRLETSAGPLLAGAVVVASGFQNVPQTPQLADALPDAIEQLHVADYRRAQEIGDAVLVVGGGQSGLQVAEDLLEAGRRVYLSTSRVGRLPRRHRGQDAFVWLRDSGQLDLPSEQADQTEIAATLPQISGAGGGRTISYQGLAHRGATLLGRVAGWDGRRLELASDLGANVRFADEVSQYVRAVWDAHAARAGHEGEPTAHDPADVPDTKFYGSPGPSSLDLTAAGISTVIWATGFRASIGWLPPKALDARGRPRLAGLHSIGAPWLTHRASGNLYGIAADAERLADLFAGARLAAA